MYLTNGPNRATLLPMRPGFTNSPDYWPKVFNQLIFLAQFDSGVQIYSAFIARCQSYGC